MAANRTCPNCEKEYEAIPKIRDFNIVSKTRSNAFSFDTVAELLKTSESELQEYDEEIKRLKGRIFALGGRKKKLEAYTVALRPLLSPIRKLPLDVLGSIFEEANSVAIIADRGSTSSVPANLFTSVCSYWRTLALGMSSLWSNIQLKVDFRLEQQQTKLLTTLIILSQASPLTLLIKCPDTMYTRYVHDSQRRHTAIDKLLEESSRWQQVAFDCPHGLLVAIFRNFHGKFQDLKSLSLYCKGTFVPDSPLSVFETAPRLFQLTLDRLRQPLLLAVPYSQITHATLSDIPSPGEVLEIMRQCANLRSIFVAHYHPTLVSVPTAITHPLPDRIFRSNIEAFTIAFNQKSLTQDELVLVAKRVMPCIELPLLSSLVITSVNQTPQTLHWDVIIDGFRNLLSRSQCHITKLTITNWVIHSIHFLSLLGCLSQLEELILHHDNTQQILADSAVSQLRVDEVSTFPGAILLPRLRKIDFVVVSNVLSDGILLDMITSRSDPFDRKGGDSDVAQLKVVRVHVKDRRIKEDIIDSYGYLVSMGLSVTLIDERGTVIPYK
jgi:hypothetical protein